MKAGSAEKRTDDNPEIASGHGVFVNEKAYQTFLVKNQHLVEVRDLYQNLANTAHYI
jgi:hypothetical protein